MAHLPYFGPADVASKSDLAELRDGLAATRSDASELAAASKSDFAELHGELRDGLAAVNQRLDRLFLALLVGMLGLVGAMVGLVSTVR